MPVTITDKYEACVDCLMATSQGYDEYVANGYPEECYKLAGDLMATGAELGFSWDPCEVCGSDLGGDRYEMARIRRVPAPPLNAYENEMR